MSMYQVLEEESDKMPVIDAKKPLFAGVILLLLGAVILFLDSSAIDVSYVDSLSLQSLEESVQYSQQCFRSVNKYDDIDLSATSSEKYFLYSPSGGFSNQRTELEYGLLVAKTLGRRLIIPKAGRHTTWWSKYAALMHEDLIPMDVIFDFTSIASDYDFVVTNMTNNEIENFTYAIARSNPEANTLKLIKPRHRPNWKGEKEIRANLETESTLLYLKGSAMYHSWFDKSIKNRITSRLPYNRCLRNMALEIVQKIVATVGETNTLNALHVRLGDYYKHGRVPSVRKLIEKMKAEGFKEDDPIYIATEPKRIKKFFRPLEMRFTKIFYSSDFRHIRKQLRRQFPDPVVNDILGMVEQLVCTIANRFIGTGYSNFSDYIKIMRNDTTKIFPELEQAREQLGLLS